MHSESISLSLSPSPPPFPLPHWLLPFKPRSFFERIDLKLALRHFPFALELCTFCCWPCKSNRTALSGIITLTLSFFLMGSCYICMFVHYLPIEAPPLSPWTLSWFSSYLSDYAYPDLEMSSASFLSFGHPWNVSFALNSTCISFSDQTNITQHIFKTMSPFDTYFSGSYSGGGTWGGEECIILCSQPLTEGHWYK